MRKFYSLIPVDHATVVQAL